MVVQGIIFSIKGFQWNPKNATSEECYFEDFFYLFGIVSEDVLVRNDPSIYVSSKNDHPRTASEEWVSKEWSSKKWSSELRFLKEHERSFIEKPFNKWLL